MPTVCQLEENNASDSNSTDCSSCEEPILTFTAAPVAIPIPIEIEGVRITRETRLGDSVRHSYDRMIVTCPFRTTVLWDDVKTCCRKRNITNKHIARHGDIEVIGYLGCWLRKGLTTPDCHEHRQFELRNAKVTSFLKDAGLIP